jgi:polysaccharide deacetylase 2 family uncharacterized protein YibQ
VTENTGNIEQTSATEPPRRRAARPPRWLREAGRVALGEIAALGVLALIIAGALGWLWTDPKALEAAAAGGGQRAMGLAAAANAAPVPFDAAFGRADPVQLAALEPAAGADPWLAPAELGGGADIARQAMPPAWRRNAVAVAPAAGRARIAIVIDDLGPDRKAADRVLALPGPLTLSILSHAADAPALAEAARAAGHELLVHVPMEPEGGIDPGPNALTVGLDRAEFEPRLDWALSHFAGPVGINNHMGSRLTAAAEPMGWLFEALERRGLLFLDSRTTKETVAPVLAAHFGLPFAERDVFLDNERGAEAVEAQLRLLEAEARKQGFAVAIGHPHGGTVAALKAWLPTLAGKGFVLVPVSDIAASGLAAGATPTN